MKKTISLLAIIVFAFIFKANAQENADSKTYWMSASEFIFSGGAVEATGGPLNKEMDINPIVRFTAFFHLQEQFHCNFNNSIGIYTGLGIRNVGMINDLNDSIKVKQRVYSLGVPLALKLGSLPNNFHVALGGEVEFFFHYKQKVFYDDEKFKKNEWVSDKVNLINPSVFMDIHSGKGIYMRFKYYLLDFLVEDKQDIKIYGNPYEYRPSSSKMFYVSIGTTMKNVPYKSGKKAAESVKTTFIY